MKTWIVSSLDEETIQGDETIQGRKLQIWGNTVLSFFLYSKLESEQNKGSWLIGEQKLKKLDFLLRLVF